MTTLLLVRHGDTDAIGKLLAGSERGWTLNTDGKARVAQLARSLTSIKLSGIYSSPVERALETALALAEPHSLQPVQRDALGEMRFGSWEGQSFGALQHDPRWAAFNRMRSTVSPPGGELMIDVQSRMVQEMNFIRDRHPEGTVAIVSHADPIRAVCAYYLGSPLDLMQRFEIGLASVSAVRFYEDQPHVLFLNSTGELAL